MTNHHQRIVKACLDEEMHLKSEALMPLDHIKTTESALQSRFIARHAKQQKLSNGSSSETFKKVLPSNSEVFSPFETDQKGNATLKFFRV